MFTLTEVCQQRKRESVDEKDVALAIIPVKEAKEIQYGEHRNQLPVEFPTHDGFLLLCPARRFDRPAAPVLEKDSLRQGGLLLFVNLMYRCHDDEASS